jgi:hypothetical protein
MRIKEWKRLNESRISEANGELTIIARQKQTGL